MKQPIKVWESVYSVFSVIGAGRSVIEVQKCACYAVPLRPTQYGIARVNRLHAIVCPCPDDIMVEEEGHAQFDVGDASGARRSGIEV